MPCDPVIEVAAFTLGFVLTSFTLLSAVKTVVLPRAASSWLSGVVFILVRRIFRVIAPSSRSYENRDRIWALYAPVSLLSLALMWVVLVGMGYALMFWAIGYGSWSDSIWVSGSSLLTLGFAPATAPMERLLAFSEATIGLGIIALLISFLPTMYNAFSEREQLVALLDVRAGTPPSPLVFLQRMWLVGGLDRVERAWEEWEVWFANLQETHTSYPALSFFRSPHPYTSWITAAGTILDSTAVYVAAVESDRAPQAEILIRAGFLALRRICDVFGLEYDPDPEPTDPISITRDEFESMLDELAEAGLPIRTERSLAWDDYRGWRVNYDTPLLRLAEVVMAPTAQWSADRSPLTGRARPIRLIRRSRNS